MRRDRSRSGRIEFGDLLRGAAAGVLAGAAMNLFARIVALATHGHEGQGATSGQERTGRGVQPAQAETIAEDDAAVRTGSIAFRVVAGRNPGGEAELWLGTAAHYAFSAAAGATYAVASSRFPAIRAGFGVGYGTLVWALADEGIVPALGLSRRPNELSTGVHLYALLGHWVYGGALDAFLTRSRLTP
jgi:hypothetical protein